MTRIVFLFVLLLFFAVPSSIQAFSVHELNPFVYYTLDETSGVREDSVGTVYDLTDINTVGSQTGARNLGADFVIGNSERLETSTGFGTALGTSLTTFSVSLWFNADVLNDNDGMITISNLSSSYGDFSIHHGLGNNMVVSLDGTSHSSSISMSDTASFHHFALSYNGSSVTMWLDGTKVVNAVAFTNTLNFTSQKLVIGSYYSTAFRYDGIVDEVAIFNTALSDGDVANLFNSGVPPEYYIPPIDVTYCIYDNVYNMNGTIGQICTTDGSTTTCNYEYSATTTPVEVDSDNIIFVLSIIIFLLAFAFVAFVFRAIGVKD